MTEQKELTTEEIEAMSPEERAKLDPEQIIASAKLIDKLKVQGIEQLLMGDPRSGALMLVASERIKTLWDKLHPEDETSETPSLEG